MGDTAGVCVWTERGAVNKYTTVWHADCGASIEWWMKCTPLELGYVYCPNCGRRIDVPREIEAAIETEG